MGYHSFVKLASASAFFWLSACHQGSPSQLQSIEGDVEFADWCQSWQLSGCDIQKVEPLPAEDWEVVIGLADELLISPTTLNLDRSVLELPEVNNLLLKLELNDLADTLGQFPWSNVAKDGAMLILSNDTTTSVEINGLSITASEMNTIEATSPGILNISGLSIGSAAVGETLEVTTITLTQSGAVDLMGNKFAIRNVPIKFFEPAPAMSTRATFSEVFEDVLFSNNFDFRDLAQVELTEDNFSNIATIIEPILPQDEIGEALKVALGNFSTVVAGGQQGDLLADVNLKAQTVCEARVNDIPVIGSAKVTITLSENLGLEDLKDTNKGFEIKVFGVKTNFGNLSKVFVEGDEIKLRIGFLTIPIDLSSTPGGGDGGTSPSPIEELSCS